MLAGSTGLEPAASGVTGRRSNQLNYDPAEVFFAERRKQATEDWKYNNGLSPVLVVFNRRLLCVFAVLRLAVFRLLRTHKTGRYRIRTCDSRRVKPVLYH
jgi:hypothetical protein